MHGRRRVKYVWALLHRHEADDGLAAAMAGALLVRLRDSSRMPRTTNSAAAAEATQAQAASGRPEPSKPLERVD